MTSKTTKNLLIAAGIALAVGAGLAGATGARGGRGGATVVAQMGSGMGGGIGTGQGMMGQGQGMMGQGQGTMGQGQGMMGQGQGTMGQGRGMGAGQGMGQRGGASGAAQSGPTGSAVGSEGGLKLLMPVMDAARGRKLFAAKGCVVCHSINGVGGTDAPHLDASTMPGYMNPFDFAARMWRGAPAMIAMQQHELGHQIEFTGAELADIIAFVHSPAEQAKFSKADIPPNIAKLMSAD